MNYVIFFFTGIIIINLMYYLFVIRKEKALDNMKNGKDILLLCKLNNIDIKDYDFKRIIKLVGLGNSIIVSTIGTVVLLLDKYISSFYLWILASVISAIVLLIPAIIGTYKILGKVIKGGK